MNIYYAKMITYFEIHKMRREGHSRKYISEYLVIDRRTVSRYLSMSEQEYEAFIASGSERNKKLGPYEDFVRQRLEQDARLAQRTPP